MEDNVFGTMDFNVGWYTTKTIDLWGKKITLKMRTSTTQDEVPNGAQQQSYLRFNANIASISSKSLELVAAFLKNNADEIEDELGSPVPTDIHSLVIPKQVLFFKNGKAAIICDITWSDENMVVLISNDIKVDYGYIIEYES